MSLEGSCDGPQASQTELIDRLLTEIDGNGKAKADGADFSQKFAQAILKRVDNKYLFKHRLTTLGAQLADSLPGSARNWWRRTSLCGPSLTESSNGYALEGKIIETLMLTSHSCSTRSSCLRSEMIFAFTIA